MARQSTADENVKKEGILDDICNIWDDAVSTIFAE